MARKQPVSRRSISTYDTCNSKRRFAIKKLAEAAAEYQMLLKPELDLDVYACGQCGGWHLTRITSLV